MRSIQEQWDDFSKNIIPRGAGEIQRDECKKSFYAGALTMIEAMGEIATAGLSEQAEEATINGLQSEIVDFFETLGLPG